MRHLNKHITAHETDTVHIFAASVRITNSENTERLTVCDRTTCFDSMQLIGKMDDTRMSVNQCANTYSCEQCKELRPFENGDREHLCNLSRFYLRITLTFSMLSGFHWNNLAWIVGRDVFFFLLVGRSYLTVHPYGVTPLPKSKSKRNMVWLWDLVYRKTIAGENIAKNVCG